MTNETGICNDCQQRETCNLHTKNPWLKVTDCGMFLMNDTLKKVSNELMSNELFKAGDKK